MSARSRRRDTFRADAYTMAAVSAGHDDASTCSPFPGDAARGHDFDIAISRSSPRKISPMPSTLTPSTFASILPALSPPFIATAASFICLMYVDGLDIVSYQRHYAILYLHGRERCRGKNRTGHLPSLLAMQPVHDLACHAYGRATLRGARRILMGERLYISEIDCRHAMMRWLSGRAQRRADSPPPLLLARQNYDSHITRLSLSKGSRLLAS